MFLTKDEKGILLLIARQSIESIFEDFPSMPEIDYARHPSLALRTGCFVTLNKHKQLRGCIGYISSNTPLGETIWEVAKLSALEDPRFPPVTSEEVPRLLIEISVLTPPVPLTNYNDIKIGVHGLILDEPEAHGLLLPQVAVENHFSSNDFLTALCQKAGADPHLWRTRFLNIKTFTAEVFREEQHRDLTGERK
ncbi:MAG: AmmeMemoRadiSam system protein A [Ignavibacteriaceae bacterium]|nr:AmmeMemoRadiSam system protein A [Ignavibacteriaceae bacterium]